MFVQLHFKILIMQINVIIRSPEVRDFEAKVKFAVLQIELAAVFETNK